MECNHEWRVDYDNFVDGCIGAICIKCGKRGCGCNVLKQHNNKIPQRFWRKKDTQSYKIKLQKFKEEQKLCCG